MNINEILAIAKDPIWIREHTQSARLREMLAALKQSQAPAAVAPAAQDILAQIRARKK